MKLLTLALFGLFLNAPLYAQMLEVIADEQITIEENQQETFYLHTISFLTRVEAEVEVPWIAKLNLRPEIELYWSR